MIALLVAVALLAPQPRPFKAALLGPEPVRAYVDLGPIVTTHELGSRKKATAFLQLEADRLGADGFFVSAGDPAALYSPDPYFVGTGNAAWATIGAIMAVAALFSHKADQSPRAVLRAYTFRDLPKETRDALARICAQLVTGEISIAAFEAERERLLAN